MKATLSHPFTTPSNIGQQHAERNLRRAMFVVAGSVLALCSLGLIVGGGYLLTEATSDGGWLSLGHGTYETDSYAVISEPEAWSNQTYALGTVDKARICVTPRNDTIPVFVGLAPSDEVERYLSDVQHVTVHGASNYRITYTQHDGQAPAGPPVDAISWTAQTTGTGTQTLEFNTRKQPDDQVLVVMNADGSPSVNGKAESLVTQPSPIWIASGLLASGLVLAASAFLLIVKPFRRIRRSHS